MKFHLLIPFLFGILNGFALTDKHEEESMEPSDQAAMFLKRSTQGCGLKPRLSNRIVGGKEADEHAFPWMVSLRINGSYFCGGSLINKKYVLTAGHCIWRFGDRNSTRYRESFPFVYLVLGDHYLNETESQEQIFGIANHTDLEPDTDRAGVPHRNDLAVIKLNGTATFNSYVSPICLPSPPIALSPGDKLTVAGWGVPEYTTYGSKILPSNVLKVVQTKVIKNEDCANFDHGDDKNGNTIYYGQQAPEDVFCTKEDDGQGVVFVGDSGSPVMYVDPITGKYVQVGLVSYRTGRISEEGHTNVTYFLKYIEDTMRDMDKY